MRRFLTRTLFLWSCTEGRSTRCRMRTRGQSMSNYIFDNAAPQASQRFASLETLYDPWTIRHLEATGIGPGWRCWEVGGGGGSIAAWLAERCSPGGHVLVTDIDPHFLMESAALAHPRIEIQRHDIASDPLPAQSFDLIHARLVLIHVPAREQALKRMAAALKPGGWLVVEDFDITLFDRTYPTANAADAALFQKIYTAQERLMAARSGELALTWGRSLSRRLQAHAWCAPTSSRSGRRPLLLDSSRTRRSSRCSRSLTTLTLLSVHTRCSPPGVGDPNRHGHTACLASKASRCVNGHGCAYTTLKNWRGKKNAYPAI